MSDRLKVVVIQKDVMLADGLMPNSPDADILAVVPGLPEGTTIDYRSFDPESKAMWFVIAHPSFEGVPDGGVIPEFVPVL